ncbi:MAG: CDP-alcohol phosphatidyltransferase family protein [Defluviitaleaceae bacterium]|nr:CDP-alcohol phosphatidyltransferase family protein [Defluviitaleaceae bacterium]
MKYIPNALSIARIVIAAILLPGALFGFIPALETFFMVLYITAGLTDLFDGPLARRYNPGSKMGANLDGTADYIFIAVCLITILPAFEGINAVTIGIVIGFVVLKILGMVVGYLHYRQLMMMHTRLSKAAAFAAWLLPIVYFFTPLNVNTVFIFLGAYCYIYLAEEIAINVIMPYPKRDIKSVFEALRLRRAHLNQDNA